MNILNSHDELPRNFYEFSNPRDDLSELRLRDGNFIAEPASLPVTKDIESEFIDSEEKTDILEQDVYLKETNGKVSSERNAIHDASSELEASSKKPEDSLVKGKEETQQELEVAKHRIKELSKEKNEIARTCLENSKLVNLIKSKLWRIFESLEDDGSENFEAVAEEEDELKSEFNEDMKDLSGELNRLYDYLKTVELKSEECKGNRIKEKKELENSVESLTEENREITSLLRIALVEKEALERSLNRMKGNNEEKRMAILQLAERGLQKVGFGFILGTGANEPSSETTDTDMDAEMDAKSDSSNSNEEGATLASSVERIMKKLRLEIAQLRRELEDSRSENARQQTLIKKQAGKLAEQMTYIKELEDRKVMLRQNVEELKVQLEETKEEMVRWKKACELEAEAGKHVLDEREKVVNVLQQELERLRTALNVSSEKLKIKEDLVIAAIAVQRAAEKSLQLADSRVAGLRAQIDDLTRQLEEAEKRGLANRRLVRHICWPWRALMSNLANATSNGTNLANATSNGIRIMVPEMQTLLP